MQGRESDYTLMYRKSKVFMADVNVHRCVEIQITGKKEKKKTSKGVNCITILCQGLVITV